MDRPSELDLDKSLSNIIQTIPPFVGRGQELGWMEDRLQEAIAGHPQVVLTQGEAGIGKTRLLQEVRSGALRRGIQVCYGRCYEDLTLPYLPFVEAFRPLLEHASQDLEHALGADAKILNRLLHRDNASSPATTSSTPTQADQDKLQLFLAMSRIMMTLAQGCPTLFVVDDLHWADRSSLDLFGHLVFTVADSAVREPMPLLIIGTYRPVEPDTHLARLIARVQREIICQTIELSGLNESEIHELIQGLGLLRPSHQLIVTVSEATQGNPLFIQEVLHHLVQQKALRERGRYVVATAAPADLRLPDQVTGAIVNRTQDLSEGCRRTLTLASFLGDRFVLRELAAVSIAEEDESLNLLEEGMRQRLLLSEGEAFRFAHPLIRHVFYHDPAQARRQRIHQQIAETLERMYATNLDSHILEIAHHLVRAGPAAEPDSVVKYARRAGDQAFALFAWGDAARYYEAALQAGESTGQLSSQEQAELHYWAGLAYYRAQDVGPCLDHYEKAIESYGRSGDIRGLALALVEEARTHNTFASVPYGTLVDVKPLENVLDALGDREPSLRGSIAAVMAEVYRTAKQTNKAKEIALRALEIGKGIEDDRLCAYASFALGLAQAQGLDVRETLVSYQDSLAYARRANDLWLQGWPMQRMTPVLILLGQLDEAESVALEACDLARKTHDWGGNSVALSALASVAVTRGNFARAEQYIRETLHMVLRSRYPWGGVRALSALACARGLRGAWTEAEDALDLLIEPGCLFEDAGPVMQGFARAFRLLLRTYANTLTDTDELLATDWVRTVGIDSYALAPFCALVELGDRMGAPAIAEAPHDALALAAERGVLFSNGWVFLIPRVLGVSATLHRQWETAERLFQTAIEVASRIGAKPELGRSYLDYARMLVSRGQRGDRRRAIEPAGLAASIFHELGMEPFAGQAASLANSLHARPIARATRPAADSIHLGEHELAALHHRAPDHVKLELADALMLDLKTVDRYVSNIMNKSGVKRVTAAASNAHEKPLVAQTRPPDKTQTPAAGDRSVSTSGAPSPVVILVTNMEGSGALIQRWGDAKAHMLIRLHNTIIRECLRAFQGLEVTHTGDGIEASFLSASSAVECAVAIQRAFVLHNQEHPDSPMGVRIGINAGEPIHAEGRLFGAAVHATFRICTRARNGQILVSDVIRQLAAGKGFSFADRGRHSLKGFPGRVHLYEVHWQDGRA